LHEIIPLHDPKLNYKEGVYELGDHVGEEALNLDLLPKLKLIIFFPPIGFPSCLIENTWVGFAFPYALMPHHGWAKQDTIWVIRWVNIKLSHHRGHVPTYPMENKKSFVHHTIKQ
jgi:hypothetical protein